MLLSESHQKLVWHPRYPPKTDTYSSDLLWVPAGQNIQWGQIPLEILEQRGETAMVDSGNWKKRLPISNCKWMTKTDYLNLISSSKETRHWITLNGDLMQKKIFSTGHWNTNNMFNLNFEPGNYTISSIFSFRCIILEKISIRYKKNMRYFQKSSYFVRK